MIDLLEPLGTEAEESDTEVHQTCCNDDLALCREDMAGAAFVHDDTPLDCVRCQILVEYRLPCGAPFCRLRRRWRAWTSS